MLGSRLCSAISAWSQRRDFGSFWGKRRERVRRVSVRKGEGRRGVLKLVGVNVGYVTGRCGGLPLLEVEK